MRRTWTAILATVLAGTAFGVTAGPSTAAAASNAVAPQRVVDTRAGLGAPARRLNPGDVLVMPLPAATGAGAASLNLTATDALGAGFLTAWPCGQPTPATSMLNFVPGQTVGQLRHGRASGPAGVCLASSAPVHVVVDLMGWFTGSAEFRGGAADPAARHPRHQATRSRRAPNGGCR